MMCWSLARAWSDPAEKRSWALCALIRDSELIRQIVPADEPVEMLGVSYIAQIPDRQTRKGNDNRYTIPKRSATLKQQTIGGSL